MSIRVWCRAAVCLAVCALCGLAIAGLANSAPAVVPPAGIPDLSQMVLLPSDFAATSVTNEGYQASSDFVAVYGREFGPSTTASGARFLAVYSEVDLATDADEAGRVFSTVEEGLRSPSFRAVLVQEIVKSADRTVRKKDIYIGRPRNLSLGDGGVLLPIRIGLRGIRLNFDVIFLERDRVVGLLVVGGMPSKAINVADATRLASTMINRVSLGLSPQNTALPIISGTAAQGQTLTATTGSWTNNPTAFTYQWRRCDHVGANCQPLSGATANTYTVTPSDSGDTVRVAVVATNRVGSSQPVTSNPTAPVP